MGSNVSDFLVNCGESTRDARIRIIKAVQSKLLMDWINAGASDNDIARNCRCSVKQLHDLAKRWKDLQDILDAPRTTQIANAWAGLIKLSQGYTVKTTRVHRKTIYKADGSEERVEEEFLDEEYFPPDVKACKAVIQNYAIMNQKNKGQTALPETFVEDEHAILDSDDRNGKLPEMEEALKGVFGTYELERPNDYEDELTMIEAPANNNNT